MSDLVYTKSKQKKSKEYEYIRKNILMEKENGERRTNEISRPNLKELEKQTKIFNRKSHRHFLEKQ